MQEETSIFSDLDMRPAPPNRYTATMSVHMCPYCNYSNYNIDELIEDVDAKRIVNSEEYQLMAKYKISETAKKFLLAGFLYESKNDNRHAAYLYLNSAWAFDDDNDFNNAIQLRKRALVNFVKLEQNIEVTLIETDILRRIGEFKEAIKFAKSSLKLKTYNKQQFLAFKKELVLIRHKNTNCGKF